MIDRARRHEVSRTRLTADEIESRLQAAMCMMIVGPPPSSAILTEIFLRRAGLMMVVGSRRDHYY